MWEDLCQRRMWEFEQFGYPDTWISNSALGLCRSFQECYDRFSSYEPLLISLPLLLLLSQGKCCRISILKSIWQGLFQVSRIYNGRSVAVQIWERCPYFGLPCRSLRGGCHVIAAARLNRICWIWWLRAKTCFVIFVPYKFFMLVNCMFISFIYVASNMDIV